MIDFIREFKFGRPQQIAALLLMAFVALALPSAIQQSHPHVMAIHYKLYGGPSPDPPISHGIMIMRLGNLVLQCIGLREGIDTESKVRILILLLNTAMVAFGVWLAGALWWVTRRLYNDSGGYVALALFCFSTPMISYSSRVGPDIIAAWGLYGLIYTAIGVAHTLYAPPRKWRPRILLLGVALGVTAGAYFAAALIGLILATAFILYLAPGRRKESLGIIAIACVIAFLFVFAMYGFDLRGFAGALIAKEAWSIQFHRAAPVVPGPQWLLLSVLMLIALVTYALWKRARYFGNTAPLIVMTVLYTIHHDGAQTAIWALPFIFTFIGGLSADLLEAARGKLVAWSLGGALLCYAAFAVVAVLTIPK